MNKLLVCLGILTLIIGIPGIASATLINVGFETGNLTGWTANDSGLVSVVTSHDADFSTYSPIEGSFFALLDSGLGEGVYTTLMQDFSISSGSLLQGWAAFDSGDGLPFNDDAYVKIFDSTGNAIATPWFSDVATVGTSGDGPWTYWSWAPPASDNYTLQFGVADQGDAVADSFALFDANVITNAAIPEPASLSLFGLGLLGLFRLRRKNRKEGVK